MRLPVSEHLGRPGDVVVAYQSKSFPRNHNWAKESSERESHLEDDVSQEQCTVARTNRKLRVSVYTV